MNVDSDLDLESENDWEESSDTSAEESGSDWERKCLFPCITMRD
jgi:hypothetical protein